MEVDVGRLQVHFAAHARPSPSVLVRFPFQAFVCGCVLTLESLCWSLKEECGHMAARTHAAVHAQAGLDGAVAARVTRVALLHNEHPLPLH
jgi:hypothetical protein